MRGSTPSHIPHSPPVPATGAVRPRRAVTGRPMHNSQTSHPVTSSAWYNHRSCHDSSLPSSVRHRPHSRIPLRGAASGWPRSVLAEQSPRARGLGRTHTGGRRRRPAVHFRITARSVVSGTQREVHRTGRGYARGHLQPRHRQLVRGSGSSSASSSAYSVGQLV